MVVLCLLHLLGRTLLMLLIKFPLKKLLIGTISTKGMYHIIVYLKHQTIM